MERERDDQKGDMGEKKEESQSLLQERRRKTREREKVCLIN
jgi:hypothetical protein